MVIPIIVDVEVEEISNCYNAEVSNLENAINVDPATELNPTIFPGYDEIIERLDDIEGKEPSWDAKYDEGNPPPYPVTSVDSRLGDVTLGDLYGTSSIPLADIASLFND